jgi:adenylosuccinate synthase
MEGVIVVSGPMGVGKTSFANALVHNFAIRKVSTRAYILERTGCENERRALQNAGDELDRTTDGAWVADLVEKEAAKAPPQEILLLDSARIAAQVRALRERFSGQVFHVHLRADAAELESRYLNRDAELKEFSTYAEASAHGTEEQVSTLATIADLVLNADHVDADTLAITTMAIRGSAVKQPSKMVDVIVGGQYGSEGKGNICANIARDYQALMRIGGPNAGHMVADPKYKYVQLPSGTGSNKEAMILIGAGSTLWLPQLMLEIMDQKLSPERLVIDPQAMVIDDEDKRVERRGLASISTTAQGVGAASARKILNRGDIELFGPPVMLARAVKQLSPFVRDVRAELDRLFRKGARVLLEGTQGTELSIHHGLYPHVTSRETSVAGCLADAGISHRRVRRAIMVVRTYPIRVGNPKNGTSGWMGQEIDLEEISARSGVPIAELRETEKGSVSGRPRRIAEFDWGQLRRATEINGATGIALTFADYLGIANRAAGSFSDLTLETQEFIRKVERVSGVSVELVSKAFAKDGVLTRGGWQ